VRGANVRGNKQQKRLWEWKGSKWQSNFVLDKGDGKASLKANILRDVRSRLLTHIRMYSSLFPR
jgi:hypothetical protein